MRVHELLLQYSRTYMQSSIAGMECIGCIGCIGRLRNQQDIVEQNKNTGGWGRGGGSLFPPLRSATST